MGQLAIEINQDDDCVELSSNNLLEAIDRFDWQEGEAEPLKQRVRLAQWAIKEGTAARIAAKMP